MPLCPADSPLCLSACLPVCLSACLPVCSTPAYLPAYTSVWLSFLPALDLCPDLAAALPSREHLFSCLFCLPSDCLSVRWCACLPVCLSAYALTCSSAVSLWAYVPTCFLWLPLGLSAFYVFLTYSPSNLPHYSLVWPPPCLPLAAYSHPCLLVYWVLIHEHVCLPELVIPAILLV